jgi:uncharacterized RDD family membrane protein YckC
MSFVKINTAFNVNLDFELAGIDKRFFAWFIDLLVRIVYLLIIMKILREMDRSSAISENLVILVSFILYLPVLFYFLAFEMFFNGQSIGKKVFNIQVLNLEGYKPTFSQYLNRWIFRLVDVNGVTTLISMYLVFNTKNEQRLGDIVAGTVVVKTKPKTQLYETVFTETVADYRVKYEQVMKLSDKDIAIMKTALLNARRTGRYEGLWRITEKVKQVLSINEFSGEPADFIDTLIKDYNYLSTK